MVLHQGGTMPWRRPAIYLPSLTLFSYVKQTIDEKNMEDD